MRLLRPSFWRSVCPPACTLFMASLSRTTEVSLGHCPWIKFIKIGYSRTKLPCSNEKKYGICDLKEALLFQLVVCLIATTLLFAIASSCTFPPLYSPLAIFRFVFLFLFFHHYINDFITSLLLSTDQEITFINHNIIIITSRSAIVLS